MEYVIRPRRASDLPGCVTALRAVHLAEGYGYPDVWPADPEVFLQPSAELGAWVVDDGVGGIRGHVVLEAGGADLPAEVGTGVGLVSRLFVPPAARRRGIAGALLDLASDEALARGLRPALNVVVEGLAAIALYERAGWTWVATGPAGWTRCGGRPAIVHYYLGSTGTRSSTTPKCSR